MNHFPKVQLWASRQCKLWVEWLEGGWVEATYLRLMMGNDMEVNFSSGNTFHCRLSARGHSKSVERTSHEGMASGSLFVRALAAERKLGCVRL